MKLKIALILYIILTLGYLVYSTYQQSKSLSSIQNQLRTIDAQTRSGKLSPKPKPSVKKSRRWA